MKRTASILCTVLLVHIFFFNVSAFKLAPYFVCEVDLEAAPQGSRYLDLLVPAQDLPSEWYAEEAVHLDIYSFSADSPIAAYKEDGYVSYVFHCKNSVGSNEILEDGQPAHVTFGNAEKEVYSILNHLTQVRFAYVDAAGNILSVTQAVRPNRTVPFRSRSVIRIQGETVQVTFESGPPYWLIPLSYILCLAAVVWVVRRLYRRKHGQDFVTQQGGK